MARKKSNEQLTPLELEIMKVLWETGPATVQTVQSKMERKLAYTTVQTMLNLLHGKGKVKRSLKNRAYHYRPAVSHGQVVTQVLGDIIDKLFGGSAENLVMNIVQTRNISPEKLAKLSQMVEEAEEMAEEEKKDGKD